MATPSTSPYANPLALQTAVLQPPATQAPQQSAAARRSFKSFVEAMDDFGGDRRDVAGMRQVLAMQEENQRVAAAQPPQPVARSFAPNQAEPEVPVVRGPAVAPGQVGNLPRPNLGNVVPGLPQAQPQLYPTAVQSSALPQLPGAADQPVPTLVIDPAKIKPAAGQLNAANPAAQRIVAYAPMTPPAPPASAAASSMPAQLNSPMVDQVREATRAGARPGVTDDTMARFAAAADRRRSLAAPMPPRLQAQEARWNRDAWQATVTSARQAPPRTAAADATTMANASVLPRLPTAAAVE